MGCYNRINAAVRDAVKLPLCRCSRYVIFSDQHRGEGTSNDNFLKNRHLYMAAMEHYYRNGFYYIELGDTEELWENRCAERIRISHKEVYEIVSRFDLQNRFLKIYGNHDMELKKDLCESAVLENKENGRNICMIHGHQADFLNSVCWKLSRLLVRYLWKPLEKNGFNDPTSAARNNKKAQKYEKCLKAWTVENDTYLIAGHSHRPRLHDENDLYINSGSCVHPEGVTCIEIEDMSFTLVKWSMKARKDMLLCVEREIIEGPVQIR